MLKAQDPKGKSEQEPKEDDDYQFCWGSRNGNVQSYESFILDGTEYSVYDCVYMWRGGQSKPDIGKLVKMWETESHEKKVEVVWFFHPDQITHWLGNLKPLKTEIFLACGQGIGLSNLNPVEAISGKCNIVCTSEDKRNRRPTEEELRVADYTFYRTFDVGKCSISDEFPSAIHGIEVDLYFNRRKDTKSDVGAEPKEKSEISNEKVHLSPACKAETSKSAMKDVQYGEVEKDTKSDVGAEPKEEPKARNEEIHFPPTCKTETSKSAMKDVHVDKDKKSDVVAEPKEEPKAMNEEIHLPPTYNAETSESATKNVQYGKVETGIKETAVPSGREINTCMKDGLSTAGAIEKTQHSLSANPSNLGLENKTKLGSLGEMGTGELKLIVTDAGIKAMAAPFGRKINSFMKDELSTSGAKETYQHSLSVNPSYLGPEKEKKLGSLAEGPRDDACPDPTARFSVHEKLMREEGSSGQNINPPNGVKLDEKVIKFADGAGRVKLDEKAIKFAERAGSRQCVRPKISDKFEEVSRKPDTDSCKWFKLQLWDEERLCEASDRGTLILFENLSHSFTSAEVEDIIWHVFQQNVKAKMIPSTTFSSPHSGLALAICKSKEAADDILLNLITGCLVLGNGRPIGGRSLVLPKSNPSSGFAGSLSIDRRRFQRQRQEIRDSVSTSHYSQSNTIEYEMAMQWRLLQARSDLWWSGLHKIQGKAIKGLMKQLWTHLGIKV